MRVKWNTSPRDCDGHLRETGVEYDDFSSHALEDLLKRGLVTPVDPDAKTLAAKVAPPAKPTTPTTAEPVATDGEDKE